MYIKRRWIPTILFVSLALICAFLSLFLPWWSIGTAPEAETAVNGGVRTEFRITKTISLYKRTGDEVFSLYLYLNNVNVTSNQGIIGAIFSVYDTTMLLEITGIVVAVVILVLAMWIDKKVLRFVWTIGMLASAVLVLVAPIYFMYNFPQKISQLDQFTPVTLPIEYIPIAPSNVTTFFGNTTIPVTSGLPSWTAGLRFWVWGAESGFFLALVASFMLFASVVLIHFTIRERK